MILNGLCKLGQMKKANILLNAMLNLGVLPDDVTYNILLEGHSRHGNPSNLKELSAEKGMIADFASYTSLLSKSTG